MRLILNERPEMEKPEVTIAYSEMTASVKRVAGFVRVSKSTILNIERLKGVKTLVNSRLEAILSNGESICVTRKYLKDIREALIRRNS